MGKVKYCLTLTLLSILYDPVPAWRPRARQDDAYPDSQRKVMPRSCFTAGFRRLSKPRGLPIQAAHLYCIWIGAATSAAVLITESTLEQWVADIQRTSSC